MTFRDDAINVVREAARLRASANAMHRHGGGRYRAGHPFRRKLPRQVAPAALVAEYAKAIRARTTDAIRDLLKPILDALPHLLAGHARDTTARADAGEIDEAERLFETAERALEQRLGPVLLREMARRAADDAGRVQASQLGAQLKALLGTDVAARARAEAAIVDQFAAENARLISSMGKATLDKIAKLTVRGFAAGSSASEVGAQIRDQLAVADGRASFIASDQLKKLNGQLNHARQQELGIRHFTWRHGNSANPRPDHEERDGQLFAYDDFDDDELPGQEPGCSCFAEPVVDVGAIRERRAR